MDRCDCEHAAHFADEPEHAYQPGHAYHVTVPATATRTTRGTFRLCLPCLTAGHMTSLTRKASGPTDFDGTEDYNDYIGRGKEG